jgi:hypothetical protein
MKTQQLPTPCCSCDARSAIFLARVFGFRVPRSHANTHAECNTAVSSTSGSRALLRACVRIGCCIHWVEAKQQRRTNPPSPPPRCCGLFAPLFCFSLAPAGNTAPCREKTSPVVFRTYLVSLSLSHTHTHHTHTPRSFVLLFVVSCNGLFFEIRCWVRMYMYSQQQPTTSSKQQRNLYDVSMGWICTTLYTCRCCRNGRAENLGFVLLDLFCWYVYAALCKFLQRREELVDNLWPLL